MNFLPYWKSKNKHCYTQDSAAFPKAPPTLYPCATVPPYPAVQCLFFRFRNWRKIFSPVSELPRKFLKQEKNFPNRRFFPKQEKHFPQTGEFSVILREFSKDSLVIGAFQKCKNQFSMLEFQKISAARHTKGTLPKPIFPSYLKDYFRPKGRTFLRLFSARRAKK